MNAACWRMYLCSWSMQTHNSGFVSDQSLELKTAGDSCGARSDGPVTFPWGHRFKEIISRMERDSLLCRCQAVTMVTRVCSCSWMMFRAYFTTLCRHVCSLTATIPRHSNWGSRSLCMLSSLRCAFLWPIPGYFLRSWDPVVVYIKTRGKNFALRGPCTGCQSGGGVVWQDLLNQKVKVGLCT